MVVLLVLFTIISFLTIDYFVQRASQRKLATASAARPVFRGVPVSASRAVSATRVDELPGGLFVGPGHVWLQLEPSGSVRVGVDRLLLSFLGDVEHAYTLPEGTEVRRGGPLVMLRRGDRALRIHSPVDGVVSRVNAKVARSPDRIGASPFDKGWLYRISPVGLSETLGKMHVAQAADAWMRGEVSRLREQLLLHAGNTEAALADGGVPVHGLGATLNDRQWQDLVSSFFRPPEPFEATTATDADAGATLPAGEN
jgi:glycine cleavage system H protein